MSIPVNTLWHHVLCSIKAKTPVFPRKTRVQARKKSRNCRRRAKQLFRKFVETGGRIEVAPNRRLLITFDRRSHNPILREAALDRDCPTIPWLQNYRVEFNFV